MNTPSLRLVHRASIAPDLRRLGVAAWLLVGSIACAHQPAPTQPTDASSSDDIVPPPTQVIESRPTKPAAVPDPTCKVRHDGQCFDDYEAACDHAGCPQGRCGHIKTFPGKIECLDP